VRKQESTLEDRLERVKVELELQEAELREATAALELSQAKVTATKTKVVELENTLKKTQEDLRRRLAGLARLGRHGYLRLFLALRPDNNLLPAMRQLRFLLRRDRLAMDRFNATRLELAAKQERLLQEKQQAETWHGRERERHDALVLVRRRHEGLIEQVARERHRLAQRTLALQDKERKLARLIGSLIEDGQRGLAGAPIQEFRGVLDWPARGELIGRFGPRRDPRYKTEVPHNGLDLAVDDDTEVSAIYPGEVLYSAHFEGYGPMVVLHHPGRVFTLYAGLTELLVEKGDVVSLGDVLGVATGTLYFEVRAENQPEDPLLWLR
jgi:septal ring factor EnvC (AmiA/AmiB activator)